MKHVEFVSAARREFLAQVVYSNNEQASLGARFTAEVEDASRWLSRFLWQVHRR